jgi:hypothetical protein
MRTVAIILIALTLAACASGGSPDQGTAEYRPVPPQRIALSPQQISVIQSAIKRTLKNPESAQFRDIGGSRSETGKIVGCGWINAKDSLGSYVGERPFIGVFDSKGQFELAGERDRMTLLDMCRSASISLT